MVKFIIFKNKCIFINLTEVNLFLSVHTNKFFLMDGFFSTIRLQILFCWSYQRWKMQKCLLISIIEGNFSNIAIFKIGEFVLFFYFFDLKLDITLKKIHISTQKCFESILSAYFFFLIRPFTYLGEKFNIS